MPKKVVLVGHCGPDNSYLRLAVLKSMPGATVLYADDDAHLNKVIADGVDLLLLNRQIDYGFSAETGVELIEQLRKQHPNLRMMLISNYPESQAEAIAAGALPGFGKREIGTPRAAQLLRDAVADQAASSPKQ